MENSIQVDGNEKEAEKVENSLNNPVESELKKDDVKAPSKEDTPIVPFPQHLKKKRMDKQFDKFMNVFRKLHINIPFDDVLEKMSSYVKFMDILANKRNPSDYETVALS